MKRNVVLLLAAVVICIACAGLLAGCEYNSENTYFGGEVVVHYYQTKASGENDYVSFTFNSTGEYQVAFSIPPGRGSWSSAKVPANFTVDVTQAPLSKVVNQYVLPDFLRVTITYNGSVEYHDFS